MQVEMTVTDSGYVTIPARLRERHLTQDCNGSKVHIQAIGPQLQVLIPSSNHNLLLRFPLKEWCAGPPKKRKLYQWGVHVKAWSEQLATDEDGAIPVELNTVEVDHELL